MSSGAMSNCQCTFREWFLLVMWAQTFCALCSCELQRKQEKPNSAFGFLSSVMECICAHLSLNPWTIAFTVTSAGCVQSHFRNWSVAHWGTLTLAFLLLFGIAADTLQWVKPHCKGQATMRRGTERGHLRRGHRRRGHLRRGGCGGRLRMKPDIAVTAVETDQICRAKPIEQWRDPAAES